VADKVFIGCIAVGLCHKGLLPVELLSLIVGRDMMLIAGGLAIRAYEKEPDVDFFDSTSQSATFEIVPTTLSKVKPNLAFLSIVVVFDGVCSL
jgi:phosphatidylglycerophosphate synthase